MHPEIESSINSFLIDIDSPKNIYMKKINNFSILIDDDDDCSDSDLNVNIINPYP